MKGLLRLAHASESRETGAGRKTQKPGGEQGFQKGDEAAEGAGS